MALRSQRPRATGSSAIPTRFSPEELARIDRAQTLLGLRSRSALIRDAVMEKVKSLESSKVVEVREVTEKEAMRMIGRYVAARPGVHYTSDVADALGIDLPVAFAAAEKLIAQGKARVTGG